MNPVLTNGEHIKAKDTDEDVISFVDVVLGLSHKPNIDLYVTGSNSKMLSTDIITEFRDKATNISIYPLSFEEYYVYLQYEKHGKIKEKTLIKSYKTRMNILEKSINGYGYVFWYSKYHGVNRYYVKICKEDFVERK